MNGTRAQSGPYTFFFAFSLSAVCAGLLTFTQLHWQKRIQANETFNKILAVVQALGLAEPREGRARIIDTYEKCVSLVKRGAMSLYEAKRDGKTVGHAMEVNAQGRYGPIRGILAISADAAKILGLRIYEQNETPGLGGRISSEEWMGQFRDKPLKSGGFLGIVIGRAGTGPNVVQGITGASKTTFAVAQMINTAIARFMAGGMELKELDFKLGPDAVTRATPGYPRQLPKPPHLREEIRRPPFMVPPEVENISLGKPVTASEEPIIGDLAQITDGIKTSGEFDYVEFGFGPQWVQIDLGEPHRVHAIVIWHYYKNPIIYTDVIVQVADDAEFTQNVQTLFNNDHDNSSGLGAGTDTAYYARWWGEVVDTRGEDKKGLETRFIRVYTNGGSAGEETRFVEIAVFGI